MATMRAIKRRKREYTEHGADHQGHEAGFHGANCRKARPAPRARSPFRGDVYNGGRHAGEVGEHHEPLPPVGGIAEESDYCDHIQPGTGLRL